MQCRLCRQQKELCRSHILPDFLYSPLYDGDNHSYHVIQVDPILRPSYQTGQWDRLLCQECEQKISPWETYAKREWFDRRNSLKFNGGVCELSVDYDRMKLFFLSILWKMSVCNRPMFKLVALGENEKKLRDILFRLDPGYEEQYPFVIWWHERDEILDNYIGSPTVSTISNITYIFLPIPQFLMAYELSDVISTHFAKKLSCREDDTLTIYDGTNSRLFQAVKKQIFEIYMESTKKDTKNE